MYGHGMLEVALAAVTAGGGDCGFCGGGGLAVSVFVTYWIGGGGLAGCGRTAGGVGGDSFIVGSRYCAQEATMRAAWPDVKPAMHGSTLHAPQERTISTGS